MIVPECPTPGLYRHFRGGLYRVLDVAQHSETGEALVLYRSEADQVLWARPISSFNACVLPDSGYEMVPAAAAHRVPRFIRVEE